MVIYRSILGQTGDIKKILNILFFCSKCLGMPSKIVNFSLQNINTLKKKHIADLECKEGKHSGTDKFKISMIVIGSQITYKGKS